MNTNACFFFALDQRLLPAIGAGLQSGLLLSVITIAKHAMKKIQRKSDQIKRLYSGQVGRPEMEKDVRRNSFTTCGRSGLDKAPSSAAAHKIPKSPSVRCFDDAASGQQKQQ